MPIIRFSEGHSILNNVYVYMNKNDFHSSCVWRDGNKDHNSDPVLDKFSDPLVIKDKPTTGDNNDFDRELTGAVQGGVLPSVEDIQPHNKIEFSETHDPKDAKKNVNADNSNIRNHNSVRHDFDHVNKKINEPGMVNNNMQDPDHDIRIDRAMGPIMADNNKSSFALYLDSKDIQSRAEYSYKEHSRSANKYTIADENLSHFKNSKNADLLTKSVNLFEIVNTNRELYDIYTTIT